MSRWIDADAFKTWIDEYVSVFKKSDKTEIKGYISHQPSIDIVCCRECRHRNERCGMGEHRWCEILNMSTTPDDFCSYGEREGE